MRIQILYPSDMRTWNFLKPLLFDYKCYSLYRAKTKIVFCIYYTPPIFLSLTIKIAHGKECGYPWRWFALTVQFCICWHLHIVYAEIRKWAELLTIHWQVCCLPLLSHCPLLCIAKSIYSAIPYDVFVYDSCAHGNLTDFSIPYKLSLYNNKSR